MKILAKRILSKYTLLMVKMGFDMTVAPIQKPNARTRDNFDFLVHFKVLFSLACFIYLLNVFLCFNYCPAVIDLTK